MECSACDKQCGIRYKVEGWMFPGLNKTNVMLRIIIDWAKDNGNESRCRHGDRQVSGPDIVSQYFPGCDRVTVGRLPNANAHSLGTSSASWSGRQLHTSPSISWHIGPKISAAGASSYTILRPVCHTLLVS